MPNLPHNSYPSVGNLRTYLGSILPAAQLTDMAVDSTFQPILLLQTNNIIAAFAFSGSDMRKSYDSLYGSFKKHYAKQQGQWDTLDLAFVFCAQPGMPHLDHFCSKVETDVYFCRKFVVLLVPPMGASLARLPFLPLTTQSGQSIRPASAQTFLKQCSVPALLAKFIVVQRERSPEGIVMDCTSGRFGEPLKLASVKNPQFMQSDRDNEPALLETVTVTNFRAYRKTQTFEIGSDVTVLYGPNGFGKTSFFDAVDFAVTGGIGRFESPTEALFAKTAQHLDSNSEESLVSLSFLRNNAVHKVTRSVGNRKHALLDGILTDRKSILTELTSGNIPAADRVDNFVNLFRATHLFSQEQQELTKEFQNDCRLSAQIVARMLAFEDYVNAVNKATKVREFLQAEITNTDKEIRELSAQIIDEKKELERLGQTAKEFANIEALDAAIEALRDKLVAAGIAVPPQKPDAAIVRGWRASLEARHAESKSRIDQLSTLTKEAAVLQRMHADLASLQQQIAHKEQELGAAEEKLIVAELALRGAEQSIAKMNVQCSEKQAHAAILDWVRTTKPVYAQLVAKMRSLKDELGQATHTLDQYRRAEEKEASELRAKKNLEALASGKLKTKQEELATVISLNESIASWQGNSVRLATVIDSEQSVVKFLDSLRAEQRELSLQVTEVTTEVARMSRQIAEVDKNQSELKNLLSQMQVHVRSGTCPLCGEDHGSKDELVRRIQKHVNTDAARVARNELIGVLERARKLAEQVASNKLKQNAADTQLSDLKKERARLDTEIGQFTNAAVNLGIVLDASGPAQIEQLRARHNRVKLEIEELNRHIQETGVSEEKALTALTNTKALIASKTATIIEQKAALALLQDEAYQLSNDPRLTQVSLDIDDEQLMELERLTRVHLTEFKAKVAIAQTEAVQKKTEMSALQHESLSIKAKITALRTQHANLQNTITQITARLKESKLPADASEKMLLNLIAEESRAQAQILLLRDSAANFELAIDAVTTAAALTQLLQNIRIKEKAVMAAERRRDQHQPWLRYFEELSRLLSSQQNEAIANFTHDFGPLTSIIQSRLRSVYGFDEIEIKSRESTISVRVKRHGEELRPTDYFSQSQQQTLLLGLFLTACSSQTWSAFSTVFLDDPVTHFDDLNTYALLDLIVGLLESDFGKRQFIISTCDEKLLQLARQKFRHLREGAKFYRFSAIGADGPIIDEIASH